MKVPSGWELILIVLVIVVLFGAKKLPAAARGIGQSLRIFKTEVSSLSDDSDKVAPPTADVAAPPALTATPTPIAPAPVAQAYVTPIAPPVVQHVTSSAPADAKPAER